MANEATVRSGLTIRRGELDYSSRPGAFVADVSGDGGPVPGAVTATVDGTDVDLSGLTTPGLCRIQNLDAANFVRVGRWDGTNFLPLMRVLAGESYVIRLDSGVEEELVGTGTSDSPAAGTLRIKADTASCRVLVEAFEA